MRFASIRSMDISNGLGIGVSVFTQGCPFHCKNCFNPETWDYNGGKLWTLYEKDLAVNLIKPNYITRLSILGGEPLIDLNLYNLVRLIEAARKVKPDLKIWIYTGYTYEMLLERIEKEGSNHLQYILDNIDVLIDGPFIQKKKDLTLAFRGSSNQRIIDMPQTRECGEVVVLDL